MCRHTARVALLGDRTEYAPWIRKSIEDEGDEVIVVPSAESIPEVVEKEVDVLMLILREGDQPPADVLAEVHSSVPVVLFEPVGGSVDVEGFREAINSGHYQHSVTTANPDGLSHYQVGPILAEAAHQQAADWHLWVEPDRIAS